MKGRLLPQTEVTSAQRAFMLALMQEHFAGVTAERFGRDLAEKNWVILLEDERGQVRGFSTVLLYATLVGGERVRVLHHDDVPALHPDGPVIFALDFHNVRRPSIARASVTSSAASRALPAGRPRAMRVTVTPSGLSCSAT